VAFELELQMQEVWVCACLIIKNTAKDRRARGYWGSLCRISHPTPAISGSLQNAHQRIGWMTTN
jgi:hypothetical protein